MSFLWILKYDETSQLLFFSHLLLYQSIYTNISAIFFSCFYLYCTFFKSCFSVVWLYLFLCLLTVLLNARDTVY